MMRRVLKLALFFFVGGALYVLCEILWRGYSFVAMYVAGGACFVLIERLNAWKLTYEMPIWRQGLIATAMVLAVEFIFGIIFNRWLHLNMWDYSDLWGNVLGQICPQFAAAWYGLSIGAILLSDYIDYWCFGGVKPHNKIF